MTVKLDEQTRRQTGRSNFGSDFRQACQPITEPITELINVKLFWSTRRHTPCPATHLTCPWVLLVGGIWLPIFPLSLVDLYTPLPQWYDKGVEGRERRPCWYELYTTPCPSFTKQARAFPSKKTARESRDPTIISKRQQASAHCLP